MRVHGEKYINRRTDIQYQTDYKEYKSDLRIDFHYICGYCGKHEMISHQGMEPDHFVPDNIDKSRKSDYSNLVYSCFTCNRKKSGKWPTLNKDKPHNEHEGFVDPATPEYDKNLGRTEEGEIEYYTSIGEYMYKTGFKFDIRPTQTIWQASQLYELIEDAKVKISKMESLEKDEALSMIFELMGLKKYLFNS